MKHLTVHAEVKDGQLRMDHYNLELRNRWLSSIKQSAVIVTYEKEKKPKSGKQLGAIFGLIVATVKQELDDRGWDVCGAEWTEHQIRACLYHQYHIKTGSNKTLSNMDMAETTEFIDSCYQWCAGSPWYIAIPECDPNWRAKMTGA